MGIPYSRQINYAFDQVTPLVAAGFEVLKTTKNIALLLAFVQVFTAVVLSLLLCATVGLLFTVNPDLEKERVEIVTPVMRWLGAWVLEYGGVALWMIKAGLVLGMAAGGILLWHGSLAGTRVPGEEGDSEGEGNAEEGDSKGDAAGDE